jgi:hypothetical protein
MVCTLVTSCCHVLLHLLCVKHWTSCSASGKVAAGCGCRQLAEYMAAFVGRWMLRRGFLRVAGASGEAEAAAAAGGSNRKPVEGDCPICFDELEVREGSGYTGPATAPPARDGAMYCACHCHCLPSPGSARHVCALLPCILAPTLVAFVQAKFVSIDMVLLHCCAVQEGGEELVWCTTCGNNLHSKCFKVWANQKKAAHASVTCVYCRAAWPDQGEGMDMTAGLLERPLLAQQLLAKHQGHKLSVVYVLGRCFPRFLPPALPLLFQPDGLMAAQWWRLLSVHASPHTLTALWRQGVCAPGACLMQYADAAYAGGPAAAGGSGGGYLNLAQYSEAHQQGDTSLYALYGENSMWIAGGGRGATARAFRAHRGGGRAWR